MLRMGVVIGLFLRNTFNTLLVLISAPHPYSESYQNFNATSNVTGATPQYTRTPLFGFPGGIRVEAPRSTPPQLCGLVSGSSTAAGTAYENTGETYPYRRVLVELTNTFQLDVTFSLDQLPFEINSTLNTSIAVLSSGSFMTDSTR